MFFPSSELGTPTPSPVSECVSPLGPKGGRSNTPLQVSGLWSPIRTTVKKAWRSVYSVLLLVLIHQTVAFHSSFLLSFSPHTSESLLTLLRFTLGTAALHSSHTAIPLPVTAFTYLSASLSFSHCCFYSSQSCASHIFTPYMIDIPLYAAAFTPLSASLSHLKLMRSLLTLLFYTSDTAVLHSSPYCFSSSRCFLYSSLKY